MEKTQARIFIEAGRINGEAVLFLDRPSGRKIYERLPIEGSANLWGDEIYFSIPVSCGLEEDAKDAVELGELGYWPTGKAFCIFFGPTPISKDSEIIPASRVNIVGRLTSDPKAFKGVSSGELVRLSVPS